MAATKYQVMYRYMNSIMNVPITNDQNSTYEPVFEFYTDPDHRIFSTDQDTQNAELEKQQEMISYANQSSNPKNDMLFVYDGCKKVPHQVWIEDQVGYVVRNWSSIRSKIGNRGDYSKEFTCLGAETPEDGAVVVCTAEVFKKYYKGPWYLPLGSYEDEDTVQGLFNDSSIFEFTDPEWTLHAKQGASIAAYTGYRSKTTSYEILTGKILLNGVKIEDITYWPYYSYYTSVYKGLRADSPDAKNVYDSVSHTASDVMTTTIPGHYEDAPDSPYCIKDQYKRIESSPWLVNCTVGSLDAALEKAKKLIEMIGIENVKVIKLVAIDQFVKIK